VKVCGYAHWERCRCARSLFTVLLRWGRPAFCWEKPRSPDCLPRLPTLAHCLRVQRRGMLVLAAALHLSIWSRQARRRTAIAGGAVPTVARWHLRARWCFQGRQSLSAFFNAPNVSSAVCDFLVTLDAERPEPLSRCLHYGGVAVIRVYGCAVLCCFVALWGFDRPICVCMLLRPALLLHGHLFCIRVYYGK
jgi:hypothetical protein